MDSVDGSSARTRGGRVRYRCGRAVLALRRKLRHAKAFAPRAAAWASAAACVGQRIIAYRFSVADKSSRAQRIRYYHDLWTAAAVEVGVSATALPDGGLELHRHDLRIQVWGAQCSVDGPDALERAGDKVLVAGLLARAGLPVPPNKGMSVTSLERAWSFMKAEAGSCVVKPAKNTGAGQGVTTNVRTKRDLRRAGGIAAAAGALAAVSGGSGSRWNRLRELSRAISDAQLIIERQIPGANYRLLYLDGVLIDAIRRDPPSVEGDGHRSVGALIDDLNDRRLRAGGAEGQRLVTRDLDLEHTLAAQGLSWHAVPAARLLVILKTTINENAPGGNHPARDELGDAVIEEGRRAAAAVGVRLAGVDILTTDPSVSLCASGGCVLEVNTTPGLAMHQHGHVGAVPVATAVLRQLFEPSARPAHDAG